MIFLPTITVKSTPDLEVNTNVPGITYNDFLEGLGPNVYLIEEIYYNSSSFGQFSNPIQYYKYDIAGNQTKTLVITQVDPYQKLSSMFVPIDVNMILDGSSQLNFMLNANQSIQMLFYGRRISNADFLPGKNNFQLMENYTDEL